MPASAGFGAAAAARRCSPSIGRWRRPGMNFARGLWAGGGGRGGVRAVFLFSRENIVTEKIETGVAEMLDQRRESWKLGEVGNQITYVIVPRSCRIPRHACSVLHAPRHSVDHYIVDAALYMCLCVYGYTHL